MLEAAKDEYADAVAYGSGIYAAGYCFGAKYVIMLAGERTDMYEQVEEKDEEEGKISKGPLIKAGVVAHGTQVTREDLCAVKSPLLMVCVENDQLFPQEVLEHGQQYMLANAVEHDIKIYPGVPHGEPLELLSMDHIDSLIGFAVVGDYQDEFIQKAQSNAFERMLSWLDSH